VSDNGKIPFLDLAAAHQELEEQLVPLFRSVLKSAGFVGGPMVEEFEKEFASFCETAHCVGVGSGTDALRFALMAAGVNRGDTVVTVPNTFIATAEAISQAGARPDFVDVDEQTHLMDSRRLEEYLEMRCRRDPATGKFVNQETQSPVTAIIPVHLYGQMADMDSILELATHYSLLVIEDACQAHGAAYYSRKASGWRKAGSMGVAAAFSFYPGKNLGACGEAGAVTTNDKGIADKVRMLRDHGQSRKYEHEMEGYNGRLDSLQAGILRIKLKSLPKWNQERREKASHYSELLKTLSDSVTLPHSSSRTVPVYHLYVIRVKNREDLRSRLALAGIATQIHYPRPLHLQPAYQSLGYKEGDFPVAEKAAKEILSLPIYPQLGLSQQKRIADKIFEWLDESPCGQQRPRLSSSALPERPWPEETPIP
jgi:dTDP-4-amino-4,6-dideoxygalactose transaminase